MFERLLENWLDNASERTYQVPFLAMLSNEKHTILQSTRHGALEEGKDVITVSPDGMIHAYQLKSASGPRLTRSEWQQIQPQLYDLVTLPVRHPSAEGTSWHKSYLVVNALLHEEVIASIEKWNDGMMRSGYPDRTLHLIDRGEMLRMARAISVNLIPSELRDFKLLGRMYLSDGDGMLAMSEMSDLLESILPVNVADDEVPSKPALARAVASAALISAIALTPYSATRNHISEINGWMLYLCYTAILAERFGIKEELAESVVQFVREKLIELLWELFDEAAEGGDLLQGNPLVDTPLRPVRITYLCGYAATMGLMNRVLDRSSAISEEPIVRFLRAHMKDMTLWGEGAIPAYLACYWFAKTQDATVGPDMLLAKLTMSLIAFNQPDSRVALHSPYYTPEQIFESTLESQGGSEDDSFDGNSYYAYPLFCILVEFP